MQLAAGHKLGTYEIIAPIGAGGMGEVYRALDTRLNREVALKVLPEEMAANADRLTRFYREARAAAALNHPNIVTLYSVEESGGAHFLTMELVDGQSLKDLIPPQGMPAPRVVELALEMADAIAAAHDKGLIHRDLKPANIMITAAEGRVKVLDFGLAKLVRSSGPSDETLTSYDETQAGVIMGTPPYMSPEQISGAMVDHRTDIFSLGTIVYEMLTGARPFQGASQMELAASILRDAMPPISRSDVPAGLVQLIGRCLAKKAGDRIPSARDLLKELRAIQSGTSLMTPVSPPKSRADEGFWVAVASFRADSGSPEVMELASGLTDEIIGGLSRFSYLRVLSKGTEGARYILEGSLRQAGAQVRAAVKLIDTKTGANLWAENYTRPFSPGNIFEIQDSLVPTIVSTLADMNGVLTHSMWTCIRNQAPETLTPYEAMLGGFGYIQHLSADLHAWAHAALKHAVEKSPNHAGCLALLAVTYDHIAALNFGAALAPLDTALDLARRATMAEPANHLGYWALSRVHYTRNEMAESRIAGERSIALNPLDANALASVGLRLSVSSRDWDRGIQLIERAMELNPQHPGWYWIPLAYNAYRLKDYEKALDCAMRINMPGQFLCVMLLVVTHAQLGHRAAASQALTDLLKLRPDFARTVRQDLAPWHMESPLVEDILDGLRKAGLAVDAQPTAATGSGENRADEGFWVAVLPFKSPGAAPEVVTLADGLSEEIVAGLSRFSYLRVIARGSTLRYAEQHADLRTVGKELGAQYVMDGSLRQAGGKLRFNVQLVNAHTGAQMWAETYERSFHSNALFELQDDLVPRVVATVADLDGVLPQSMAEVLRAKSEEALTPHEALLRSLRYFKTFSAEEQALAKRVLERAIGDAPGRGDLHALLSHLYGTDYWVQYDPRPDSLSRALAAARRAVDVAPSSNLSYWALAMAHFMLRDLGAFRIAAQRAIELNRMDGFVVTFMGLLTACSGDWDRGLDIVRSASALNPNHAGWHLLPEVLDAYRRHDYPLALNAALHMNLGGHFHEFSLPAAAYGQLGQIEDARRKMGELLAIMPDFAVAGVDFHRRFLQPELVEHLVEGWRKAGLTFASDARAAT